MAPRILLTGATGYVGGTILHQLATSTDPSLSSLTITCLVRGQDRASTIESTYNKSAKKINTILCGDFSSDLPLLREQASRHDIVINAGTGFHAPSAIALVEGLAAGDGAGEAWMLHTSGCSNIADLPLSGQSRPETEWVDSDSSEAVYEFEKSEEARDPYPQRTSELGVLDASLETGWPSSEEGKTTTRTRRKVNAVSVQIANMIGTGEGLFQKAALFVPITMGWVVSKGYGFSVGDGTGCIDWVHIHDVGGFYLVLVRNIVEDGGEKIPRGKKGILFPTVGRTLVTAYSETAVDVCFEAGVLPLKDGPQGKEIRTVSVEEAAATTVGNLYMAEVGFAAHRMTKGVVGREKLGWVPKYDGEEGAKAWKEDFWTELRLIQERGKSETIGNCINGVGKPEN